MFLEMALTSNIVNYSSTSAVSTHFKSSLLTSFDAVSVVYGLNVGIQCSPPIILAALLISNCLNLPSDNFSNFLGASQIVAYNFL